MRRACSGHPRRSSNTERHSPTSKRIAAGADSTRSIRVRRSTWTLLDFRQFLADVKKLSPRTICTKMMVVEQMLKTNGRSRLLRRGDWPRYVERIPQAYSPEQLKLLFAACRPDDFLLFQFFLGSGFREKEVQFLAWRDIGLEEQLARVTAKSECGFFPKTWEEREALLPNHLIER